MKIAVSLPDDLVLEARAAVEAGLAESVSGYVAEAMRAMGRRQALAAVLADMDRELGPPGPDALAWAESALAE